MVNVKKLELNKEYYAYYVADLKNDSARGLVKSFTRVKCIKILSGNYKNQARFQVVDVYLDIWDHYQVGNSVPHFLSDIYEIDGNNEKLFIKLIHFVFKGKWLRI
jgi:hypothetical protein